MEVGLGATIDGSDNLVGADPTAHVSFGLEFEWKTETQWIDRCEIKHWSHALDGKPFNNVKESFSTEGVCFVKIGGRRKQLL